MSDQQCAFDNWEEAAEQVIKTEPQTQPVEPPKQPQKPVQVEQAKQQAKQTLKQKIDEYKNLTPEEFQSRFMSSEGKEPKRTLNLGTGKVLKNDKDFVQLAKQIGEKICQGFEGEQTVDEEAITVFFQELVLFLYGGLDWVNMFEVLKKIKTMKVSRKDYERKLQKQAQRKRNKAEQQKQALAASKVSQKQKQAPTSVKDDLFGGAVMMNSKQEQQERKKKAADKKVQQKKPDPVPADDDDDDDFM